MWICSFFYTRERFRIPYPHLIIQLQNSNYLIHGDTEIYFLKDILQVPCKTVHM